jgi:uncharacterized protein (DUF362 family)
LYAHILCAYRFHVKGFAPVDAQLTNSRRFGDTIKKQGDRYMRHQGQVGLAKGKESYSATLAALELVQDDIHVPSGKPVLIKPNLVSRTRELAVTPVGAVRATMEILKKRGVDKFIVGEGTAGLEGDTMGAFEEFGYFSLKDDFEVEFRNLNENEWVPFEGLDLNLNPTPIRLAKTYFESYVVSVARMKTHLEVILTLAIKNIAISSIHNVDRHSMGNYEPEPNTFSHDPKPIHLNIARLFRAIQPDLAVIDGVVGMEGEGPGKGTPVESGVALASTNFLGIDLVGAEVMGADPRMVGYLWYLMQLTGLRRSDVSVVGEDPKECITTYDLYEGFPAIMDWWVEDWHHFLEGSYEGSVLNQVRD